MPLLLPPFLAPCFAQSAWLVNPNSGGESMHAYTLKPFSDKYRNVGVHRC
jgi:hypothetical protein